MAWGRLRYIATLTTVLVVCAHRTARAQTTGWALDRFDPAPVGDLFFTTDHPLRGPENAATVRAGVVTSWAFRPLTVTTNTPDGVQNIALIEHLATTHVQLGVLLGDRLLVHASLPVVMVEQGTSVPGFSLAAFNTAGVGDPKLGFRVRVFGETDSSPASFSLGASGYLGMLGINARASNRTDESFRAKLNATVSGRTGIVRWSAQMGIHFRPHFDVVNITTGNEFQLSAALGFVLANNRLTLGPEVMFATVLDRAFQPLHNPLELLAGAHYRIGTQLTVGVALSLGLTSAAGTPSLRTLFQFAWAPEAPAVVRIAEHPVETSKRSVEGGGILDHSAAIRCENEQCTTSDPDHDKVFNVLDQCPELAEGLHPDPLHVGCPLPDTDTDGVVDSEDQCPEQSMGAQADTSRRGCPWEDKDHDTVSDVLDHCIDLVGMPTTVPETNGCPGLVHFTETALVTNDSLQFLPQKEDLAPESSATLVAVVEALRASSWATSISIDVHTDDTGEYEQNIELSSKRAHILRRWLVAHGVAPDRLEAHGYGSTRPSVPTETLVEPELSAAREHNRRVEFRITARRTGP